VDEFLTDEQQADIIRRWIRENGAYMLGGLVLGLGGLFGWSQWQDYQNVQAEQASDVYEEILVAVSGDRGTQADALMLDLKKDYTGSPYLDQARFMMARYHLDRSEFETASDFLADVVVDSKSVEMKHIARLRLVRVRIQQQKFDEALNTLEEGDPDSAFSARYHDLRGDVFYSLGRLDEARLEYVAALADDQQPPVIDRMYAQAKLDDLAIEPSVSSLDEGLGAAGPASEPQSAEIESASKD
jgi:predicted negative regulator of RcsB-dependent stress response